MAEPEMGDEFVRLIRKSGLLTKRQIKDGLTPTALSERPTSVDIAKALVDQGLLTRFQAKQLLQGRQRGLLLDGYKLLEPVGVGGMGWVYVAEEVDTGWTVAIKVLSDDRRMDAGMVSRFQLEAQAGLRLKHHNILRTIGLHKTEDLYGQIDYVVMELVKGVTLVELIWLLREVPVGQVCDVITQAAEGLQCAHDQALVHRDIKPDNVLVRSNGAVKVLDFGLAMLDENDEEFAMAMIHGQDRLGTADYVAPEQIIDSYKVDARADVYALGCTFYAALTGRVPFPAKKQSDKLKAHLRKRPRPVRELRPDVPERVEKILLKMMAKHPKNRIQSASEVARYLKPFAERQKVEFDFKSIVSARVKQATGKGKTDRGRSGRPSGSSATTSNPPDETERPQAEVETIVQEDTQVKPSDDGKSKQD